MTELLLSFPVLLIGGFALLITDILYAGKHASKNTKILWLCLVCILPFTGIGILVWAIYPFTGHLILKRESLAAMQGGPIQSAQPVQAAQVAAPSQSSVEIISSANFNSEQPPQPQSTITQTPPQAVMYYSPEAIEKFKKTTTIMGAILGVIMVSGGVVVVGLLILIATVMYACSQPGAKCM
jgi:hypothetical protein